MPKELPDLVGFNVSDFTPVEGVPGAFRLARFPERLEKTYRMPGGKSASRQSTGCELRLVPEGNEVIFRLSSPDGAKVHAYQGDFYLSSMNLTSPGLVQEFLVNMKSRVRELPSEHQREQRFSNQVLRLVVDTGIVYFHAVDSYGFAMRAPQADEVSAKTWLAYGSSITKADNYGYIHQAANRLAVDVLNKGMSGSCAVEAETAEFLAKECAWDFMTCEWGINMRGHVEPDDFAQRVTTALATLIETKKPIFLLTVFPNGSRFDSTEPQHLQREEAYNDILRQAVADISNPLVQIIEGAEILRSPNWLTSDLLHPTHYGHSRMGECLAQILASRLEIANGAAATPIS